MVKTPVTTKFSNILKSLFIESGKTIEQLSTEIKLPRTSLWKYQNDFAEAPITALSRISDYFGVSTDYLLGKSPFRKAEDTPLLDKFNLTPDAITNLKNLREFDFLAANIFISAPSFVDFIHKLEHYAYLYGYDVTEASTKLNKSEGEVYEMIRNSLLQEVADQAKAVAEDVRKELDLCKTE